MARAGRFPLLRLAGSIWLVACSEGAEAPWAPRLRSELTLYDYAVYSAWLAAQVPGTGLVLVDDKTTSTTYPGLSLISIEPADCQNQGVGVPPPAVVPPPVVPTPADTAPMSCGAALPVMTLRDASLPSHDEAARDQGVQQELSLPLEPRLTGASYQLVHDPVPGSLMQRARLVLAFSRVGFDRRLEVATFRALQAPVGDGGVVGPGTEYTVWARRTGSRWEVTEAHGRPSDPGGSTAPVGTVLVMTCDSSRTTDCIPVPVPIPIPWPLPLPRPR